MPIACSRKREWARGLSPPPLPPTPPPPPPAAPQTHALWLCVSQVKVLHQHPEGRLDDSLKQEGQPQAEEATLRLVRSLENATVRESLVAACWLRAALLLSSEGFTSAAQGLCVPARAAQTLALSMPPDAGSLFTETWKGIASPTPGKCGSFLLSLVLSLKLKQILCSISRICACFDIKIVFLLHA